MMDDLRDLYQEVILDHGKNPRNFRHPDDCNRQAEGDNPLCGDQLAVYLKLNGEGMVEDVAFQGRGCAISMASASMMTEMVQGRSEADARALFAKFHKLVTGTDDEVDDDETYLAGDPRTKDIKYLQQSPEGLLLSGGKLPLINELCTRWREEG
ncbi:MAG: SUF system NifU family Fe-S cluster assembly protein, partial [Rhodospirillaceae bacterium]|nr:SUF system NifU family Fe-S cluster assembly protein [Rhodospirillaceae bacterium]